MLDFICIGAQKAGTTWLYQMLSRHPRIAFPAGKEVHFWDTFYDRGLPWYQTCFPDVKGVVNGEITPAYAILPSNRIAQVKLAYPQLRLFFVLRNPIQRAWSSAQMALGRAEMTITEASDQWFADHFRSVGSLARGSYITCLQRWYQYFGTDQLRVFFYEQIQNDPVNLLGGCLDHLGLERDNYLDTVSQYALQKVFAGAGHNLRVSLLPVLRELYYPEIESLAQLLGKDLSHWKI